MFRFGDKEMHDKIGLGGLCHEFGHLVWDLPEVGYVDLGGSYVSSMDYWDIISVVDYTPTEWETVISGVRGITDYMELPDD